MSTFIGLGPGINVIEDDGDPYNNQSQIRFANGSILFFDNSHDLEIVAGSGVTDDVILVINLREALTGFFKVGNLTVAMTPRPDLVPR